MKHKHHDGKMIDQHHVADNHQQGIERVKQRKGDLKPGQGGKMSWKGGGHESNFERHGDGMTPRKG